MASFQVFERDGRNLSYVGTIDARDKADAHKIWKREYGLNYGHVVILSLADLG